MTELLAPAGSVEALHSAINAGCDAVYIGGKMFGARAYADNPELTELMGAIDYCHIFNKKLYLTVNTLLKNDELTEKLYDFLRPYYEEGLDGVIISDPAVMKAVSVLFPDLPIHISTQASVTSAEGAGVLTGLVKGITRVVPARELSIEEIELFKKKTDLEIEVFVHGAMCVSYSGQCLMSSIAGGRSGNRGRCAQPCRKNYDTGINDSYILSCKDMCTIPAIGRLMRAGVDSFKIEGRMKSPVYVAATVATYRKYMDIAYEKGDAYESYLRENAEELEKDIERLREIYNRGGFCTGFLLGEKNLISSDRASHNGVLAGKVTSVSGREATVSFNKNINAGDVLEIRRDDGSSLYEFTSGSDIIVGKTFKVLVSKGQKAAVSQRVFRIRNNKIINEITGRYVENDIKLGIGLKFVAKQGEPLKLTVYPSDNKDKSCTVFGACPEPAKTSSASEENIKKHLSKTGDSLFEIKDLSIDLGEGLFIPVGVLNNLRREAFEELERTVISGFKRNNAVLVKDRDDMIRVLTDAISLSDRDVLNTDNSSKIDSNDLTDRIEKHVLLYFEESLKPVYEDESIKRIYLPLGDLRNAEGKIKHFEDISRDLTENGRELYIALPFICRNNTLNVIKGSGIIKRLAETCGFLIRNNEELSLFENIEAGIILDHTMHIFNRFSAECYRKDFTYSPELNRDELMNFGLKNRGELILYGRLPLMQTAHCVYRNEGLKCLKGENRGCFSDNGLKLRDAKGYVFPVIRRCEYCTNIILNSSVLDLRDMKNDIKEIAPGSVRYEFTTESPEEIKEILKGSKITGSEYTFGHFKRGVL